MFLNQTVLAQTKLTVKENRTISTSSDSVIVGTKGQYIEFVGNFKGVYGVSTLSADRVKVFYYSSSEQKKLKNRVRKFKNDKVKKIIAKGSVIIISENKKIVTESAVYTDLTGILVLSGKNTLLETGKNRISGSRIEYNVVTGKISVEGANTIINPDEKAGFKF